MSWETEKNLLFWATAIVAVVTLAVNLMPFAKEVFRGRPAKKEPPAVPPAPPAPPAPPPAPQK